MECAAERRKSEEIHFAARDERLLIHRRVQLVNQLFHFTRKTSDTAKHFLKCVQHYGKRSIDQLDRAFMKPNSPQQFCSTGMPSYSSGQEL